MAKTKQDKNKKKATEADGADEGKVRSARTHLLIAVAMSLASLGGGFFLARLAYLQDASEYEPEYVEEEVDEYEGKDAKTDKKYDSHGKDDHSSDGYDDGHSKSAKKDSYGDDGHKSDKEPEIDNGLLDFGAILTNIQGFNPQGAPTNAFLKIGVVLVYRTDPGAKEQVRERELFMRDLFTGYLRGLTEGDLRGMAGVLQVKAELLKRARAAVGNDLPQEILINDLIVQ